MIIKIALSPNFGEFIVPNIFSGTLEEAKSTNGRIAIADYILNHHRERDIAIRGLEDIRQNWYNGNLTEDAGRYYYLDTNGNPQSLEIVEIDTDKPWEIDDVHGIEFTKPTARNPKANGVRDGRRLDKWIVTIPPQSV